VQEDTAAQVGEGRAADGVGPYSAGEGRAADGVGPYSAGEGKSTADARALRKAAIEGWQKQIEKTEASIRRAEKALADMERTPQIKREAEKALAAWREQNSNDAARAIREMRQERESLRQYVKLLRDEARLTTPDTRRLLPSDVRRMAQNLVKEQGSSAAVGAIRLRRFSGRSIDSRGRNHYNTGTMKKQ